MIPRLWSATVVHAWLPMAPAVVLMLIGFVRILPAVSLAHQDQFALVASSHLAWSDIASIYGRADLSGHAFPYVHGHSLEYPVLTGVVFWMAGFAGYASDATPAFIVNYVLLACAGLGLVALIARQPGANPWLMACSPALALYTGANWDLLALLPGIAALILYEEERDTWATVLLAASVWLKFFAILWLPLVVVARWRAGKHAAALRVAGLFAALSALVNLPFALRDDYEWGLFFSFNRERSPEVNFWTILRDYHLGVDTINLLSLVTVLIAMALLALAQWRSPRSILLPAAAIILSVDFFIGKVYSPQYFIWLLPFAALLAAPFWLWVALAFIDLLYYVASFQILYMTKVPGDAAVGSLSAWDFDHVLTPSMEAREFLFLVLICWLVVARLLRREPLQAQARPGHTRPA